MTLLKTTGYFASAAVMVPLRTGIVRDIRIEVYNKVLRLPLSFFSEERKGDIIARMSADVSVVENSLTSSLDMLIRNPIALVVCFITLFTVSWQLTLFVLVILPLAGWVMGSVSRKLKSQSVVAQGQWGDIMSQLDETLGGLRIIKAFIAERKMSERFAKINNGFRTEVFRRLGLTGSSGDWERLVRGVIQEFEENNSGVDLFHFDSDEDVFCVYSQYIDDLMLLSKMIRAACDNEKTMGMYLNMSEVAKA